MRSSLRIGGIFSLACAAAAFGCGGDRPSVSPSSLEPGVATTSDGRVRALDEVPAPVPTTVTISIVGSSGNGAFLPNPSQAAMGDQIVWTNTDQILHRIVLDDGTLVGDVAPGASTDPVALSTDVATYHCALHPSMVGSINGATPPELPPDYGPPPDDYGGYAR